MDSGKTIGASRIALCSRDELRRDALAVCLEALPGFTVVGRVRHATDLVPLVARQRPGIVLFDGGRHYGQAVPTVRLMRERFPGIHQVVLHEHLPASECAVLRECGAAALVSYGDGLDGVVQALRALTGGQLPARAGDGPGTDDARDPDNGTGDGAADGNGYGVGLTERQREILLLLASGRNVAEIASLLDISPGTVENHKRRVYAKLNCATATQAVARAAALGIIDSSPPAPPEYPAPPPSADRKPGTVLVVVVGDPGTTLDRVLVTLIRNRLPVVREHCPKAIAEVHYLRTHRGPVVRVLVNPTAAQWWVGATLGWTAILVHDGVVDTPVVDLALTRGVLATIAADHVEEQLVPVLNLAAAGYLVMDPVTTRPFNESVWARSVELPMAAPALTPRERDILHQIGRNQTVRQTARALGIALKTVENAQGHLFRKLGVHNRAAALAKAYSLGLLHPTQDRV